MSDRGDVPDGSYSCSPSKQGPLRLKLSMNNMPKKNAPSYPTHTTESSSDNSDNELNFSLGGTPSFVPAQLRTTHGSLATTFGLQATGSASRIPQPVAGLDWTSATDLKEEIEAAKTLLFGLSAGAGVSPLQSSSTQSIPSTYRKSTGAQSSQSTVAHSTSKLNSKRAGGESNSEGEDEDLGFGDSEYFHDSKYVYPPLAEMTEEDKNNSWKPGQRKKKSEKVDSTWNPKSKLLCSPSLEVRPVRQTSRRSTTGSLLNSPLEESAPEGPTPPGESAKGSDRGTASGSNSGALNGSEKGSVPDPTPSNSKPDSNAKVPGKRGRQKAVTTTKQRLAKILKLDKSGRYMR